MADQKPTIAIFGATGHLGMHITRAFLAENTRNNFDKVVLFTRQSANLPSEVAGWQKDGLVALRHITQKAESLHQQLNDVDIVVNVIGSAGDALRTQIVHAMAGTNVKLYLPSEFGVDHTVHDFNHPEWDKKKAHFKLAEALLKSTKVCRAYAGLFTEDSIGPWFGFDTKNSEYESYGDKHSKVSYTSLNDVGLAVASLTLLPISDIPSQVHFSGDCQSMQDVADIMKNRNGADIKIVERDLKQSREKELKAERPDPSGCLRFLMGEGRIKHTIEDMGCDNELVNPNQSKWKWKTLSDLADDTDGRPWADAVWS